MARRSQTSGAARERARRDREFLAELEKIEPTPNLHTCETPECYCRHEGECCEWCGPF